MKWTKIKIELNVNRCLRVRCSLGDLSSFLLLRMLIFLGIGVDDITTVTRPFSFFSPFSRKAKDSEREQVTHQDRMLRRPWL